MAKNPEKVLQKEIKKAETAQKQQLKDAQKAEIKFLKAEGATKAEIKAERKDNKVEYKDAKGVLAPTGLQYIPQRREDGFITSNVGTYQDTYAAAIQPKIEQAIGLLSEYRIPQSSTRYTDDATITTGMSLNNAYALAAARESGQPITAELLKEQYGGYVSGANRQAKIFNAVDRFANDDVITATDFDKKLKPVKGVENLVTSKIGGGTTGVFRYDPATESYRYLSATPVKVTEEGGGFLSGALNIIGSIITPFNPLLGSALVATGTGIGGGDFGDILKNVALNYAGYRVGGAITRGLGLGSIPSLSDDLAAATNLLTNPADELIGVASSIKTAAQNAGSTIYDAVTNPQQIIDDFTNRVANSPAANLFRDPVAVQNPNTLQTAANQVFQTPPPGIPLPAQNLPTGTPIPAPAVSVTGTTPSITGGLVAPAVTVIGNNQRPPSFQPTLPPGVLGGQPAEPTSPREEEGGLFSGVDLTDVLTGAGIIAGAAGGGGGTTTGGAGRPPVLAPDIEFTPIAGTGQFPGMPGGIDWNAFMNLYSRVGLGAGQYLGYDLVRGLGNIPTETLLGTPIMGGNVGQTSMGQTSLV